MAWWRLFPKLKLNIVRSEGQIVNYSTQLGSTAFLRSGGRTDIWKIKREKFMKNILGLVRKGKTEEANELFHSMISKHGVRPTTPLFNVVIKGNADVGDVKSSFRFFNELKKRGLSPSNHTYSSMFNACSQAKHGSIEILDKLLAEIERRDVVLNTQSFNAQLSALVHCGLVDKAFETFSSSKVPQSIETFGTLLLAAAKDRQEGMVKAVTIWNELVKHFALNLYCYNTLLLIIRDSGIPNDMLQTSGTVTVFPNVDNNDSLNCHSVIAEKRVVLTLRTTDKSIPLSFRVFVSKTGIRWIDEDSLSSLLQSMKSSEIKPDIRTVSILSSLFPDFDKLLKLSREFGIEPDHRVLKSASQFRRLCGDIENAKAITKRVANGSDDVKLNVSANVNKDVKSILDELQNSDLRISDARFWKNLIESSARRRKYEDLRLILKKMRHSEVMITHDLFNILEEIVSKPPQKKWILHSFNGFKGYYKLWCSLVGK